MTMTSDAGPHTESARPSIGQRLLVFALISVPLLAGYLLPGFAIVALAVVPLAWKFGTRVWPASTGRALALIAAGVLVLTWFPATEPMLLLLVPLCGLGLGAGLLSAGAAVACYAVVGAVAVVVRRPVGWLAAGLGAQIVYTSVVYRLVDSGVAEMIC